MLHIFYRILLLTNKDPLWNKENMLILEEQDSYRKIIYCAFRRKEWLLQFYFKSFYETDYFVSILIKPNILMFSFLRVYSFCVFPHIIFRPYFLRSLCGFTSYDILENITLHFLHVFISLCFEVLRSKQVYDIGGTKLFGMDSLSFMHQTDP